MFHFDCLAILNSKFSCDFLIHIDVDIVGICPLMWQPASWDDDSKSFWVKIHQKMPNHGGSFEYGGESDIAVTHQD